MAGRASNYSSRYRNQYLAPIPLENHYDSVIDANITGKGQLVRFLETNIHISQGRATSIGQSFTRQAQQWLKRYLNKGTMGWGSFIHTTTLRPQNNDDSAEYWPFPSPLSYFFPLSFTSSALSSLEIICWFGIAFPDSYSWMICGFSFINCRQERIDENELQEQINILNNPLNCLDSDICLFFIDHLSNSCVIYCVCVCVNKGVTWASWDWVNFFSCRACMIAFFSSLGTFWSE